MSLHTSRISYRRIIPLVLFVVLFLALPVPSPVQKSVHAGPSIVWAGSPDETLKPPEPPRRSSRLYSSTRPTISGRMLFAMLWRAYWATVRL